MRARHSQFGAAVVLAAAFAGPAAAQQPASRAAAAQQPATQAAAALVSDLTGRVTVRTSGRDTGHDLRLYDTIARGSVLSLARDAAVTIVLARGKRFQLRDGAQARVEAAGVSRIRGDVRELPSLPPLPAIPPIASAERPVGTAGAVRLRGVRVGNLYPDGASAIASATVLSFEPVAGAPRYVVRVDDEAGRVAFSTEVDSPPVRVPPDRLQPGRTYYWSVETVGRLGATVRGSAAFSTLPVAAERARAALRQDAGATDARTAGFLAEIDRRLGLLREARDGFRAAVQLDPSDGALRAAQEQAERTLASRRP